MPTKHYYMDVRELPEANRYAAVFKRFDELEPGEILVVHNDHNPRPLHYKFRTDRAKQFEWEIIGESFINWLVFITKVKKNSAHPA